MRFAAGILVSALLFASSVAAQPTTTGVKPHSCEAAQVLRCAKAPRKSSIGAILFIHGLRGNSRETFQHQGSPSWLELLAEDKLAAADGVPLSSYDVWSVDYDTRSLSNAENHVEVVSRAIERDSDFAEYQHVVIIAHSLGGLVAKGVYAALSPSRRSRIHGKLLFGVPSQGVVDSLPKEVALQLFAPALAPDLRTRDNNSWLTVTDKLWLEKLIQAKDASGQFRSDRRLPLTHCFHEKRKTPLRELGMLLPGEIHIVSEVSAGTQCDGPPYPADRHHLSIVKPIGYEDEIYKEVRHSIYRIRSAFRNNCDSACRKLMAAQLEALGLGCSSLTCADRRVASTSTSQDSGPTIVPPVVAMSPSPGTVPPAPAIAPVPTTPTAPTPLPRSPGRDREIGTEADEQLMLLLEVKQLLRDRGYFQRYRTELPGGLRQNELGLGTRTYIQQYQRNFRLTEDGEVSIKLRDHLKANCHHRYKRGRLVPHRCTGQDVVKNVAAARTAKKAVAKQQKQRKVELAKLKTREPREKEQPLRTVSLKLDVDTSRIRLPIGDFSNKLRQSVRANGQFIEPEPADIKGRVSINPRESELPFCVATSCSGAINANVSLELTSTKGRTDSFRATVRLQCDGGSGEASGAASGYTCRMEAGAADDLAASLAARISRIGTSSPGLSPW